MNREKNAVVLKWNICSTEIENQYYWYWKGVVLTFWGTSFIPNRSLDFGWIARLWLEACFSVCRRRSGLRRGKTESKTQAEAGKMPKSFSLEENGGLCSLMTDLELCPFALLSSNSMNYRQGRRGTPRLYWVSVYLTWARRISACACNLSLPKLYQHIPPLRGSGEAWRPSLWPYRHQGINSEESP